MKTSAKTNYLFTVLYQIFTVIVPLITTPYISKVLGVEGIGIYSYTYSIVRYFLIFAALGTVSYAVKKIGINQDDEEKRSIDFWEIFILKSVLTIIMLILYYTYVSIYAENKLIAGIQGIYLIGTLLDVSWFFQGLQDFKKISIRNFIIKILNIIYIFVVVKTSTDLWKYVFGLAIFTALGSLIMWSGIRKYLVKVNIRKLKPSRHMKQSIELFIPTIATQIYAIIDKTMIGAFSTDSIENGYYEQAFKIVDMSLIFITTIGTVLVPRVSKAFADKDIENVQMYLKKSYKLVWLLGVPLMLGIVGIVEVFVPIFFGEGFEKVKILLPILSLLYIPMGMNYMTGRQYMIPTNQQNKYNELLLIGGFVNVIINFILIPKYFSIGAAIGSVTGEFCILSLSINYLIKTKQYSFRGFFKDIYKYCFAGIVMLAILLLINKVITFNLIGLLILIMIGAMIYMSILILLKDEIVMEQINNVKIKFSNIKNKGLKI